MPQSRKKILDSPAYIFGAYVVVACLAVAVFRAVFPGGEPPLPVFEKSWRQIGWLLDAIALFPALALSGLVLPFGMNKIRRVGPYPSFSDELFAKYFKVPVVTALVASCLYAAMFFLVLPLAQNLQNGMRFSGETYRMARDRAVAHAGNAEWTEASQYLGIADAIWHNSPDLALLRGDVEIGLDRERFAYREAAPSGRPQASASNLPGRRDPVDAADAIALGRAAFDEGRMFDAHWLATLGGRLARSGSPEEAVANRLAATSWNEIQRLRPGEAELQRLELFRRRMSGYDAMLGGDWIRAFYVFSGLSAVEPNNPDVRNFLALSEREVGSIAFFLNQMNVTVGRRLTDVLLSMPAEAGGPGGRAILRLENLSSTEDMAFAVGLEYMLFDSQLQTVLHLRAPYAKFTPLETGDGNQRPRVLAMLRALDRYDAETRWEPTVEAAADGIVFSDDARLLLDVSYDDFLLLSRMGRDVSGMHMVDLFRAASLAAENGHVPRLFQAEILGRLGSGLFLLPTAIAAIAAGWYLRARRFPRYLFVPLLFVLPVVFNGASYVIKAGLNVIGVSLTAAFGFPSALLVFSALLAAAFVGSLLLVASQRGDDTVR